MLVTFALCLLLYARCLLLLLSACYFLLVDCYFCSLLVTLCPLLVTFCALLVTFCALLVTFALCLLLCARYLLLFARCSLPLLFVCYFVLVARHFCSLFVNFLLYVMKVQYKLRKDTVEKILISVLVASAKIPEREESISPSSFYRQLPSY